MTKTDNENQLETNRKAYEEIREEMEREHIGKFILMHDGKIVSIHSDSGDAYSDGCEKFGLGNFSIESVGEQPVQLGIYTPLAAA